MPTTHQKVKNMNMVSTYFGKASVKFDIEISDFFAINEEEAEELFSAAVKKIIDHIEENMDISTALRDLDADSIVVEELQYEIDIIEEI